MASRLYFELVLVDQGRECANLLELVGRRHRDAEIGTQPAPIKRTVQGDEANAGCDVILEPARDLRGIEIDAVGMTYRDVDRADLAAFAPGEGYAADPAAVPRPARAATGAQALVVLFGVDRDNVVVDAAQIRQVCGNGPDGHAALRTRSNKARSQLNCRSCRGTAPVLECLEKLLLFRRETTRA